MKTLVPWSWGDQYLKSFFNDDVIPRIEGIPSTFPRLDVEDKDNELFVTADVPGVKQEEINIEVEEDRLIIHGKIDFEKEEKKKNFYRKERRSGNFYRELQLPCFIDSHKVTAQFKNGTVIITLPKSEENKEKRVKVTIK
jgi:HSP20 family protein